MTERKEDHLVVAVLRRCLWTCWNTLLAAATNVEGYGRCDNRRDSLFFFLFGSAFALPSAVRTVAGTLESNQENVPTQSPRFFNLKKYLVLTFFSPAHLSSLKTQEAANGGHANGQSSSASSSSSGSGTMVKTFQAYLPPTNRTYSCVHCRAHLASHDELISKSFQGSQGRAYLFNSVVNVACGQAEERVLLTGLHAVADIYCECCRTPLGWKYEHAFESSQKYKEEDVI
uniref:Yippee domain-containing protein n=1 Tax=Anopheles farauti TaxID=69004 RepID=A0A182Q0H1_9DIPT